jgi:hypothetical protein
VYFNEDSSSDEDESGSEGPARTNVVCATYPLLQTQILHANMYFEANSYNLLYYRVVFKASGQLEENLVQVFVTMFKCP